MLVKSASGAALTLCFVLICTLQDLRHRSIDLTVFLLMAVSELLWYGCALHLDTPLSLTELLPGVVPGAALLLLSAVSSGALGSGDALFFLLFGTAAGLKRTLLCLSGTLLSAGLASLALVTVSLCSGKSARGRRLPLLPFAAPPVLFCVLHASGLFAGGLP